MFTDGLDIVNFVRGNVAEDVYHVIDADIKEECKDQFNEDTNGSENPVYQCLVSLVQIAISCTNPSPNERMSTRELASRMHVIQTSYLGWKPKKRASPQQTPY